VAARAFFLLSILFGFWGPLGISFFLLFCFALFDVTLS